MSGLRSEMWLAHSFKQRRPRIDGPKRHHYRLFCLLDYVAQGVDKALLVVIDGRDKTFNSAIPAREYSKVLALGTEYLSRNPRSIS